MILKSNIIYDNLIEDLKQIISVFLSAFFNPISQSKVLNLGEKYAKYAC